MIRFDRVTKVFAGSSAPAVENLSLEIPAGEIVVLVGPSGCGKTTSLKMINRLVEPNRGRIEVAGRDVRSVSAPRLRQSIGYVIQRVGLFPHRTVAQNIETVPRLLSWEPARIRRRVEELATLTGLDHHLLGRYPSQLSGGQQQRVGVARALASDPPVLLMDEPFGAVDPIIRARLQDELLALQARLRKTIVLVTHDIDEAIKLGDRVALMQQGGHLEQYGTPAELLSSPASRFVEEFLGADRGLVRLDLAQVGQLSLQTVPIPDGTPRLGPQHGLIEALRLILSAPAKAAAVYDNDNYLGLLTLERIVEAVLDRTQPIPVKTP